MRPFTRSFRRPTNNSARRRRISQSSLYDTGVYDAMYLAGLIADDSQMTKKDLKKWVKNAGCPAIAEYTVLWVTSQGNFGHDLALEWIDSKAELVAAAG